MHRLQLTHLKCLKSLKILCLSDGHTKYLLNFNYNSLILLEQKLKLKIFYILFTYKYCLKSCV